MNYFQRRFGGVSLKVYLLATIVLALMPPCESSVHTDNKERVDRGFEAGKEILTYINDKKFQETLTKVAGSVAPFLGAIGPFVGFILAFLPTSDSDELKFMKDMMKKIDSRFNKIDSQFDELKRSVVWTNVAVNFGAIEQNINAMHTQYKLLYNIDGTASENMKDDFIVQYESVYQLSGLKLYQAIVQKHGSFQENLGQSVMRYKENDRKETQTFLLGVLRLLFLGTEIELAYYKAKNYTALLQTKETLWVSRILEVRKNYEDIDKAVTDKYLEQAGIDIRKFSADMSGKSNEQFVKQAYPLLKNKFYWRDWMIVAWNTGTASTANYCGGYRYFDRDGRHFVVSSMEVGPAKVDVATMRTRLQNVGDYAYTRDWLRRKKPRKTSEVFNRVDKSNTCTLIVLHKNNGAWYTALPNRFIYFENSYQDFFMFS